MKSCFTPGFMVNTFKEHISFPTDVLGVAQGSFMGMVTLNPGESKKAILINILYNEGQTETAGYKKFKVALVKASGGEIYGNKECVVRISTSNTLKFSTVLDLNTFKV